MFGTSELFVTTDHKQPTKSDKLVTTVVDTELESQT